ncbi:vacuolar ATPase proteolipid subunit [Pelomyxa schiedti]|nr:vacuolar ATPase proteolipid subunit [Pelomyxa schiedti]
MLLSLLLTVLGRTVNDICPAYAPFFGFMGITAASVFTVIGSAYGTAKSSVGISSMGILKPELVMKCIIPTIFAGIIGIYGLILCVILLGNIDTSKNYPLMRAFSDLASGLCCGLCGMAAGMAIGIVGDSGVRATGAQPRLFVPMVLVLIFSEALALYGVIVAILCATKPDEWCGDSTSTSG